MKKTLIALMALAGVAMAAEMQTTKSPHTEWTTYLNSNVEKAITSTGYQAGDDFSLSFTVTWNHAYQEVKEGGTVIGYTPTGTTGVTGPGYNSYTSGNILTLATFDNGKVWGIFSQAGSYIAMENTTAGDRKWVAPDSVKDSTFTWTSESTEGKDLLDSWVSLSPTYAGGNVTDADKKQPGIVNLSVTVDVTSAGSTITLGMANGAKAVIETAYVLDANDLEFTSLDIGTSAVVFSANGQTVVIPEPATATLSLLALAGLAARRRRK